MKAKLIKIKDIKASANEGFTLIELLVVIGILAILMGIVLIAINPAHQFALANDTNRRNAVAQILSGVGQYEAEHNGSLPPSISGLAAHAAPAVAADQTAISSTGSNLCTDLVGGSVQYIPALPGDPTASTPTAGADITATQCSGAFDTGYTVSIDSNKRVTIYAPHAEAVASPMYVTR